MEIIKCIIVDDEYSARHNLNNKLKKFFEGRLDIVGMAESVKEARGLFRSEKPSLIFLDITMPNEDGFQLLDEYGIDKCEIIFVTAHNNYAMKAFNHCAAGYLLKPIDNKLLQRVVGTSIDRLENRRTGNIIDNLKDFFNKGVEFTKIAITTHDGIELFEPEDVMYIEASEGYSQFHIANRGVVVSTKRLNYYEALLDNVTFVQIHRSYIVNKKYITRIDRKKLLVFLNEVTLPISKAKRETLLDQFIV